MTPQIPHIPRYFTVKLPAVPPLPEECCAHTAVIVIKTLRDYGTFRGPRALPDAYANGNRASGQRNHERHKRTARHGDGTRVSRSRDIGEILGNLRFLRW